MGLVAPPPLFGDANIVWVRREDETTLYGTMKDREIRFSSLDPSEEKGEAGYSFARGRPFYACNGFNDCLESP